MLNGRRLGWLSGAVAVALAIGGLSVPTLKRADPVSASTAEDHEVPQAEKPGDPVRAIALSPEGRRVAWIEGAESGSSIWVLSEDGGRHRVLRRTDATDVTWSADGRWLILPGPDKVSILTTAAQPGSGILTRLGSDTGRRFLAADTVRAAALIATQDDSDGDGRADRYGLIRVRAGGIVDRLWAGRERVSAAVAAADGSIWLRLVRQNGVEIALVDPRWGQRTVYHCRALERCRLVAAANRNKAYVVTAAAGDLDALYRLDANGTFTRIVVDPLGIGDVGDVTLDTATGSPVAVQIPYAGGRAVAANRHAMAVLAAIARRYPDASEVRVISRARGRWLIGVRDGRQPVTSWQIADDAGVWRQSVFPERAMPAPDAWVPTRRFQSFRASDGMKLFAYVTKPVPQPRHALPLVVLVHGGPWSASPPGYSETAADLAQRGFLVVEPQFRASRGYGRRYMFAAGDDLGAGRLLRDIRDSVDWMVAEGGGDRNRVAIMGASFGGYAALLATTLWPERFRGAVAAAPPADFGWISAYQAAIEPTDPASPSLRFALKSLGLDLADRRVRQRLAMQSPMGLARQLRRPVLLLAGDQDRQVPVRSVAAYAARLCGLRRPVTYYVARGEGHHLESDETSSAARVVAEDFLARLIDPTAAVTRDTTTAGLTRRSCATDQATAGNGAS